MVTTSQAGLAQRVDEAIVRMRALAPLDDAVVAALRELALCDDELEVFRINPHLLAEQRGFSTRHVVDACVVGCRAGLFEFSWGLTCPWCGMYVSTMPRLADVTAEYTCSMCDRKTASVMDSLVEVSFGIAPAVRPLSLYERAASDAELFYRLMQNRAVRRSPGIEYLLREFVPWRVVAPVGATVTWPAALEHGERYRMVAAAHDLNLHLVPQAGELGARLVLNEDGLELVEMTADPGVRIENRSSLTGLMMALWLPAKVAGTIKEIGPATFGPHLSGKDLLCNQLFRDFFASETLSAGIALTVENLTMLFTDLKGSTALYDQIGDVRAFALVSEHFKILLSTVAMHGGAVVKTIGDAVMGAFSEPESAARAAIDMCDRLAAFNASSGLPPLSLKIGLHSGACIVVNSNDRLDYFGQTVNVAARVQGLAEGDELVLSDAVYSIPSVRQLIRQRGSAVSSSLASLKGVGEQLRVHTVAMGA